MFLRAQQEYERREGVMEIKGMNTVGGDSNEGEQLVSPR
jgi:hypothetical protein